jgi:heptosyltransferase III
MDFWIGIPLLNLLTLFRRKRPQPDISKPGTVKRIGIMCSPALGDTLLFSAAVQDLRQARPDAEIIHLCMKQNLAAAELIGGIDRRVLINLTDIAGSVKNIRAQQLDVLLDFTSWQRLTAFYTLMSGAHFTAGFSTAGQHRSHGYDLTVEHRADRHEVENFLALLHAVGIPADSRPSVVIPPLPFKPLAGELDVVVFHLWASGARSWLREWPEERWIALAKRLSRADTLFAITGAPSDMDRTKPFLQRMTAAGLRATAFVGADGFISLAHLLQRARVVVSVNTGVMHLAAIVGAATVSINGPNRNGRWGPVGSAAIGVESPGEGCGYLHLGFNFDGNATDCMERITVEMVADAAEAAMAMRARSD